MSKYGFNSILDKDIIYLDQNLNPKLKWYDFTPEASYACEEQECDNAFFFGIIFCKLLFDLSFTSYKAILYLYQNSLESEFHPLMQSCLNKYRYKRPTFSEIVEKLAQIGKKIGVSENLSLNEYINKCIEHVKWFAKQMENELLFGQYLTFNSQDTEKALDAYKTAADNGHVTSISKTGLMLSKKRDDEGFW